MANPIHTSSCGYEAKSALKNGTWDIFLDLET